MKSAVALILSSTFPMLAWGNDYKPLPLPNKVIVTSSKPREIVWSGLSAKEQQLAIHLINAADAAQPISYLQSHRHALIIKKLIETSLSKKILQPRKNFWVMKASTNF